MTFVFLFLRADINKRDNFKWTPLHHAAHSGVLDVVQACVKAGASVNAESITRTTPLMRAVESSSFPVCEYLISKGARVTHENVSGLEPLTVAAEFADPRLYHFINEKVNAGGGRKPKSAARKRTISTSSSKRPQTELTNVKTNTVIDLIFFSNIYLYV
jgi:ankyrin repeat protein